MGLPKYGAIDGTIVAAGLMASAGGAAAAARQAVATGMGGGLAVAAACTRLITETANQHGTARLTRKPGNVVGAAGLAKGPMKLVGAVAPGAVHHRNSNILIHHVGGTAGSAARHSHPANDVGSNDNA